MDLLRDSDNQAKVQERLVAQVDMPRKFLVQNKEDGPRNQQDTKDKPSGLQSISIDSGARTVEARVNPAQNERQAQENILETPSKQKQTEQKGQTWDAGEDDDEEEEEEEEGKEDQLKQNGSGDVDGNAMESENNRLAGEDKEWMDRNKHDALEMEEAELEKEIDQRAEEERQQRAQIEERRESEEKAVEEDLDEVEEYDDEKEQYDRKKRVTEAGDGEYDEDQEQDAEAQRLVGEQGELAHHQDEAEEYFEEEESTGTKFDNQKQNSHSDSRSKESGGQRNSNSRIEDLKSEDQETNRNAEDHEDAAADEAMDEEEEEEEEENGESREEDTQRDASGLNVHKDQSGAEESKIGVDPESTNVRQQQQLAQVFKNDGTLVGQQNQHTDETTPKRTEQRDVDPVKTLIEESSSSEVSVDRPSIRSGSTVEKQTMAGTFVPNNATTVKEKKLEDYYEEQYEDHYEDEHTGFMKRNKHPKVENEEGEQDDVAASGSGSATHIPDPDKLAKQQDEFDAWIKEEEERQIATRSRYMEREAAEKEKARMKAVGETQSNSADSSEDDEYDYNEGNGENEASANANPLLTKGQSVQERASVSEEGEATSRSKMVAGAGNRVGRGASEVGDAVGKAVQTTGKAEDEIRNKKADVKDSETVSHGEGEEEEDPNEGYEEEEQGVQEYVEI
eukprot:scaffold2859_cov349-Pavlova_lutheri.AAC.40